MWSWKSKSSKECVTTHQPNEWALKMDDAQAYDLYSTLQVNAMLARVGGCTRCNKGSVCEHGWSGEWSRSWW